MRVTALDHLVLNVADVERSLAFYCGPLGLTAERADAWRSGEAPFPSVRVSAGTVIDLVRRPEGESGGGRDVDHICLVVEPLDWREFIESGALTVLEGPVPRWGARGSAQSVYVQDPDGNGIELRWYPQDDQR